MAFRRQRKTVREPPGNRGTIVLQLHQSAKKTEAFDVHGSKPGLFLSLHPEEFRDPGTTLLWWPRGAVLPVQFVNHPDKASPRTTQVAPSLTGAARGLGGPGRGGLSENLKEPPTEKPENAADKSFRGSNLQVLSSWKQS